MPAEAGIQSHSARPLDSRFRGNDTSPQELAVYVCNGHLARLLNEAQHAGGDTVSNTGSGAVATHGSVAAGAGGVAVKGDVHGSITLGVPEKKE